VARGEFETFRSDVEGNFLRTLELAPDLARRLRSGRRARHFVGTAELPNFFRKPYGRAGRSPATQVITRTLRRVRH